MKRFLRILLSLSLFLVSGCVSQSEYNPQSDDSIESSQPLFPAADTDGKGGNSSQPLFPAADTDGKDGENSNAYSSSQIAKSMGIGWNLGNQFEASIGGTPNETAWGNPPVTEELIQLVKSYGFSTVRIPT